MYREADSASAGTASSIERMKECPALRATKRRRGATTMGRSMDVLVIDVGGTHVKILATGQNEKREFDSGPKMTAQQMVAGVRKLARDWSYDVVSIGYPGPVLHHRPVADPKNWAPAGWGSTSGRRSAGRLKSSTMRRCRRLAAIRKARCCSSAWEPGSARRSLSTKSWSRWSLVISLTKRPPMRTMSASEGSSGWARKGGGSTSSTWLTGWSPLSSPTILCSAAATPRF